MTNTLKKDSLAQKAATPFYAYLQKASVHYYIYIFAEDVDNIDQVKVFLDGIPKVNIQA